MLAAQKWNVGVDSSREENYAPYVGLEYAPESMLKEAIQYIKTNKKIHFSFIMLHLYLMQGYRYQSVGLITTRKARKRGPLLR